METITEVKERPILFSTPMVKAVLADLKDITRRTRGLEEINSEPDDWEFIRIEIARTERTAFCTYALFRSRLDEQVLWVKCPYGQPGDILWVRETWSKIHYEGVDEHPTYIYKADFEPSEVKGIWKPSIHMPRAACRIRLEIKSITVERLHDITEEDAFKEGIDAENEDYCAAEHYQLGGSPIEGGSPARFAFIALWTRINGAESWNANPFVWRVEFSKP